MKISDELLQYCLEDGYRGDALRKSVSDMILNMAKEIKENRDAAKTCTKDDNLHNEII